MAVSPHLDDAAFSAGGTLARHARLGDRVTVVTCFTGNVEQPRGFALACQLDKGLGPDVDYMALRRAEDERAWAVIDADVEHLQFLEAPHRGYGGAPELFGDRLPGDDAVEHLVPVLSRLVATADLVLGPLGIGGHVDHLVVREALQRVVPDGRLLLWEDWPYSDRTSDAPADADVVVNLDAALLEARIAMCAAYQSQLGFQFGGEAVMALRLKAKKRERFHRPDAF
ncbi:PIG-L family deacetylase [Mycobacterium sp. MYCO198283]|uniref:PIG-L deacetylase family protein n=1 Tax=Mycobacterium sp. MYCO198283 TaxID=2883505 RepID=UPI001E534A38|nr:PIG-L family deacetylase [Mycobacterium sp. MYCO198283]MCG5431784.1 PIG-L family deacetylase [Mycobacterium sp. MYCO198283]